MQWDVLSFPTYEKLYKEPWKRLSEMRIHLHWCHFYVNKIFSWLGIKWPVSSIPGDRAGALWPTVNGNHLWDPMFSISNGSYNRREKRCNCKKKIVWETDFKVILEWGKRILEILDKSMPGNISSTCRNEMKERKQSEARVWGRKWKWPKDVSVKQAYFDKLGRTRIEGTMTQFRRDCPCVLRDISRHSQQHTLDVHLCRLTGSHIVSRASGMERNIAWSLQVTGKIPPAC